MSESESLLAPPPPTPPRASRRWMRAFFPIWGGQVFSLLGSHVAQFALVWWLTEATGSATVLATASLVAFLPSVLLGPLVGVYVDRWSRRWVMVVADSAVALVSLWLGGLFWMGVMQPWHIYVAMFLRSVGGTFHWPAMQASTALMVPERHLTRVSGFNQILYGALNIIGPPLGALLMELLPLHGVMLVDVVTAALAVSPLFFVRVPQPPRKLRAAGERPPSVWADLVEGLRYLWRWQGMMILIAMALFFKVTVTPAFSLLPLLVSDHFGRGAVELGLLQSLLGIGAVLGGVFLGVWGGFRRRIHTLLLAMVICGVGFLGMGFAPQPWFWLALAGAAVLGFAVPMIDGPFMAIAQASIAPELQGRVLTLIGSLLNISAPLGLVAAGPISDAFGLQIWYITAGIACILLGLAGGFVRPLVQIEDNARGDSVLETG